MRSRPSTLTAFEIAVRCGCTALAGFEHVVVHCEAERTPRLSPFKARILKDSIYAERFSFSPNTHGSGYHHAADAGREMPALQQGGSGREVGQTRVCSGADEEKVDRLLV